MTQIKRLRNERGQFTKYQTLGDGFTAEERKAAAHKEFLRYISNAKEILETKAGTGSSRKYYADKKYVRMAGNTAWNAVLLMLEAKYYEELKKKKNRRVWTWTIFLIAKENRKALDAFNSAYDYLHLLSRLRR